MEKKLQSLENRLLEPIAEYEFDDLAIDIFRLQAQFNPLYQKYLNLLNIDYSKINTIFDIPFLPIQFFKSYDLKTGNWQTQKKYASSGTTGKTTSWHCVKDELFCHKIAEIGFNFYYENTSNFAIFALLPSYLERNNSSLVSMAKYFIDRSEHPESGFFLHDYKRLQQQLTYNFSQNIPTLLLGVSFALMDFAEQYPIVFPPNSVVMETGGMKGKRKELTKNELHSALNQGFGTSVIHAEYGMTELFSQAYSKGNGLFEPCPTLKILIRDATDPFEIRATKKSGGINVIDLANLYTCSFIATDDLGKQHANSTFEVLGRLDDSDVRGCNLMVE